VVLLLCFSVYGHMLVLTNGHMPHNIPDRS
jgi:hypothetical protein